jgi:hypothetical protein
VSPQVSDRLRNTVRSNQQFVNPGANFMLLNGMLVEVKNFEIYSTYFCSCPAQPWHDVTYALAAVLLWNDCQSHQQRQTGYCCSTFVATKFTVTVTVTVLTLLQDYICG